MDIKQPVMCLKCISRLKLNDIKKVLIWQILINSVWAFVQLFNVQISYLKKCFSMSGENVN